MKKLCYAMLLGVFSFTAVQAQEAGIPIIKPEVAKAQIMFKKTVWRRMDLREMQNRPFNSRNGQITALLLQAVEEGLIKPYQSDSCLNVMADDQFKANTTVERQDLGGGFGGGFDSGFGGGFGNEDTQQASSGPKYDPIPKDVYDIMYIKEEVMFDRNRSRMYWYIRSLSVALPGRAGATWNPAGFEKVVAHFNYDDVVALFRGPYAEEAIWFNNQNEASHRNFMDAMELRLFSAPIVKLSNAQDLDIRQITSDPFEAVMLQQQYEYDLMEYESELWEY